VPSEDPRIASKTALPQSEVEYDSQRSARLVVFGSKPTSEQRLDAKQREKAAGNAQAHHLIRLIRHRKVDGKLLKGGDPFKGAVAGLPV
jgi:hypothetical protein